MQESNCLVSIVIPAYNAGKYIAETLDSILAQTYQNFEIIVINDGSTDDTEGVVKNYEDSRIQYFFQQNQGVSTARNNGFLKTKGQYIVFFDADDVMSPDFLEKRVAVLENDSLIGFCCSSLIFFPNVKEQFGACDDIPNEVLLYNPRIETCPSNYMFRWKIVEKIKFHPNLSSSADRLFILEVDKIATGKRIEEGKLHYRFMPDSMSGRLTKKMVDDNAFFYTIIAKKELIPPAIKTKVLQKGNYILGVSYLKIGCIFKAFKYGIEFIKIKLHT